MAVFDDTVGDMIQSFGYFVGEPSINNTRWPRAARLRFLNLSQLDAVTETRCLEETFTYTVTAFVSDGDEVITFPNNMYDDGILEIYWVTSGGDYNPLGEFHPRFQTIQNDDTGQPARFFRIGTNLHLMPKQDASGSVIIIGQKMPNELVNDTDVSLIPAPYRHLCTLGAVKKAFREDDEYGKADRTEGEYLDLRKSLKKYAKGMRSKRTPRIVLPRILSSRSYYR